MTTIDLRGTNTSSRIEEMADYYGLKPKRMNKVTASADGHSISVKNKCTVHFYAPPANLKIDRFSFGFSYDGNAKAAYQVCLNILHSTELQKAVDIII